MNQKTLFAVFVLGTLFAFAGNSALACACQNKTADAGQPVFEFPAAIGWSPTLDAALKSAKEKNKPIAIYVASKAEYDAIGEAPEKVKEFATVNGGTVPTTIFQLPKVAAHLREMGVVEFVKIHDTAENRELLSKYQASTNSMIVVSPAGEKIEGGSILGGGANKFVASVKSKIDAWQSANLAQSK